MPWTFAHPAAAIPFRRLGGVRLPMSGLVIGSLMPDSGYYIGRYDLATAAHSMQGILWYCMPVSFALVMLLQKFRRFLIAPLPESHVAVIEGLSRIRVRSLPNIAKTMMAVLVGASTHVAWDALTHAKGAVVASCALLRIELFTAAGRSFAIYNILQHASTVIGVAVLVAMYARWVRRLTESGQRHPSCRPRDYIPIACAAVLAVVTGFAVAWLQTGSGSLYSVLIVRTVVDSTIVFVFLYLLLAWHATSRAVR